MSLSGEGGVRQLRGVTSMCLAGSRYRCWDTYCISLSDSKTQFSSPVPDSPSSPRDQSHCLPV